MDPKLGLRVPVTGEKGIGLERHQFNISRCRYRITAWSQLNGATLPGNIEDAEVRFLKPRSGRANACNPQRSGANDRSPRRSKANARTLERRRPNDIEPRS
jgi:hypothetical protein